MSVDTSSDRRSRPGVWLEELTWIEARSVLTPGVVVVIPLGAAAKEHGPHLPLGADAVQARYLADAMADRCPIVIAPLVAYHYFPAFTEYAGSTTLRFETARDLLIDLCQSLARFGPRRFYCLNTGISTLMPLRACAQALAACGVIFRYSDFSQIDAPLRQRSSEQSIGSHADEVETSRMLYIAPELVDMARAVKDSRPQAGGGGLTQDPRRPGVYSPTGVWGDPTLATRVKGEAFVRHEIDALVAEIEALRRQESISLADPLSASRRNIS